MTKFKVTKIFVYLIPVLLILAVGILVFTTIKVAPNYKQVLGIETVKNP